MTSVHVIIVNYNAGDWLRRCLKSVLDYSDSRVTVVDNNSSDDSVNIARTTFADHECLAWQLNDKNVGFAKANNQVLKNLSTDFALLLNPDCEINQDTVAIMLSTFEQSPSLGLASCGIFDEDGSVQKTCRRRFPTPWSALVRLLQLHRLFPNNDKFADFDYGDFDESDNKHQDSELVEFVEAISGAFMMVRREAIQDVGLLDEDFFMHCEDLDWCKRFEQSSWDVGFVRKASVIHSQGISSKSRPIKVLWTLHKGMNRFFDKHYYSQYSLFVRVLVKCGIIGSFAVRSLFALFKGWVT